MADPPGSRRGETTDVLTVGVLGANGFVGSRLIEVFHLNREAQVRPIVHTHAGLARVARFSLDWRVADAVDRSVLTEAFRGCDVIVHSTVGTLDTIVRTPEATYRAAEAAGVRRIVYLSTASVHGQDPEPGTDETSPLSSRQSIPYNNAKVVAERQFFRLRRRGRVELVVLRPGIVIGPRDNWVSRIAEALSHGRAYLVGGGTGICNTIYVDNLVHAVRLAMSAPVDGEAFLVGDRETVTWRELYAMIAEAIGCSSAIRPIAAPASFERQRDVIGALKELPGMRRALDLVPGRVKAAARRRLESVLRIRRAMSRPSPRGGGDPWKRSAGSPYLPSEETALLHRCRYKLPYAKARTTLGYEPPVSLEEALRRTIGWLEFIGYPVRRGGEGAEG
jgi:2-alkyl-3-oxoalkanoate reductase